MFASSKNKILLYSFISICFIAIITVGILKTIQISNTQGELTSTQSELTSTKTDLSAAITELSESKVDLQTTTLKLEQTTSELEQTQGYYTTALAALDTENALADTLQDSIDNIQIDYDSATAGYDYVYRDPTYQECKDFIAADMTFIAKDVKANALKLKIRCGYVAVRFGANTGQYLLVAFNTTDRGIIYFYLPYHEEVDLQVGKHFWTECVHHTPVSWDDTVMYFKTIW